MSFNFLFPSFLLGALGITAPILIHFMTRRQKKIQRFSAVYLLFQSKNRSLKQSRPNKKFLLFIRCLGVILLSIAMASPIFLFGASSNFVSNGPSAIVFILDDSYSMETKVNQKSYYTRALKALLNINQSLPTKSIYSVILGSNPNRVLQKWTAVTKKSNNILKSNQPSSSKTEIGAAIKKSLVLLDEVKHKNKEIYILTDRDKNGWNEEHFSKPIKTTTHSFKVIDFSEMRDGVNKAAIEHAEVQQSFLSSSRVFKIKSKTINLSQSKPINKLKISVWTDGKERTRGTIDIPVNSSVEKEFSFPLESNKSLNGELRIEDDSLLKDNTRFFSYQPDQTIKTLLVDGDPNTIEHQSETFYLERALNPLASSRSSIEPNLSTIAELSKHNLFNYSVVILCNARDLPLGYEQELRNFVLRGGALFITLGNQVDAKFYNEKLGNILPVYLKSIQQIEGNKEPFRFLIKPSKHPVLKVFKEQTLNEMRSIEFQSIFSVEAREDSKYTTPVVFSNGFPALIESIIGKGKVFLFTSSIDRDWNNFPIQTTFLPWIQRLIKYSARGLDNLTKKNLLVGESFEWEVSQNEKKSYIVTPEGKIIIPPSKNGKIIFKDTYTPGVYQLYRNPKTANSDSNDSTLVHLPQRAEPAGSFTVNIDSRESFSKKISNEEINNLLPKANIAFLDGFQKAKLKKSNKGIPLFNYLIILVGTVLLFEGWLIRNE